MRLSVEQLNHMPIKRLNWANVLKRLARSEITSVKFYPASVIPVEGEIGCDTDCRYLVPCDGTIPPSEYQS